MRLLFIADGRSPIALNWIEHFLSSGDEVHLVSTFDSLPDARLASYTFLPTAFSGLKRRKLSSGDRASVKTSQLKGIWSASAVGLRTALRQLLAPLTLPAAAQHLRALAKVIAPDLVHAMRIPYEGMLAALASAAPSSPPLLLSVWGNDFTLHAPSTPLMRHYTRLALARATALHADCRRDVRLAQEWGFPAERLAFVLPGAGGVQTALFFPPERIVQSPVVIQPRGVRAYVQNRVFFQAIAEVLQHCPQARFICPNMADEPQILAWVRELGLQQAVELLPRQTRAQMAGLFRRARVVVSPTTHDGTPNTLLEAMACGCLPVAGDLESVREWITPGENGLLAALNEPEPLAQAILRALQDDDLCARAREINLRLVAQRAAYERVMAQARQFYQRIIAGE